MLIYKIYNTINDKIYIGQTTQTLKERIHNYKEEVKFSKHLRPIIAAMRKYGFENFYFEILEDQIQTKEELDLAEQKYIKLYHSLITENGYNIELGGNSVGKHSDITKQKIRTAQLKEKNHMWNKTGYQNATSKKIIELTTGNIYESANLAAIDLNLNFSHVCAVARGKRGSHKGYVFRYLDEDNNPIQPNNCAYIKSLKIKNSILPHFRYLINC